MKKNNEIKDMLIEFKKSLTPFLTLLDQKIHSVENTDAVTYLSDQAHLEAQDQLEYKKNKDGNYDYTVIVAHRSSDYDEDDYDEDDIDFAKMEIFHETFAPVGNKPLGYLDLSHKIHELYENRYPCGIEDLIIFPGHIECQFKKGCNLQHKIMTERIGK
jgi:hypothetical protein